MKVKRKIHVCFSSDHFYKYADNSSTVVVVDLLRATTVISTALENGVSSVVPVKTLDEAIKFKNIENHILAAERNTLPVKGFDYGNSPYHYLDSNIIGKNLVLTTTNGTKAIHIAKDHKVITASFVNIKAVSDYLISDNNDIIILCSGWKGYFNLEDSIFAGALCECLLDTDFFITNCDSLLASTQLYSSARNNLFKYLEKSSYRKRNSSKEILRDTQFCLNPPITSNIVPIYINKKIVKLK